MKKKPKVMVMSGYGLNCEEETAFAFEKAGAEADIVHINDLIKKPKMLSKIWYLESILGFFIKSLMCTISASAPAFSKANAVSSSQLSPYPDITMTFGFFFIQYFAYNTPHRRFSGNPTPADNKPLYPSGSRNICRDTYPSRPFYLRVRAFFGQNAREAAQNSCSYEIQIQIVKY